MAWELSSWLALVRCIQILGAFAAASMNGFLVAYIHINKLGLSQPMIMLEWMICAVLVYTALVLLFLHTGGRSSKRPWLAFSLVMDVVFTGLDIGIITMMGRAGVPSHCSGLTRSDFAPGDAPNKPSPGYSTIRFSDGSMDAKGELDRYCAMERGFYFVAVAIIFSYMVTVVLTVLRMCQDRYTKLQTVYNTMDALHRDRGANSYALADKLEDPRPTSLATSPRIGTSASPVSPSEGLLTPQVSIHQPLVSTESPQHTTQSLPQSFPQSIPRKVPAFSTASSSRSPPPLVPGIASDDSGEQEAAAAMITDGNRFTGGYDPGMSVLPPYSPSSPIRMGGHGDESNELRLSGYVKGETRAQTMKDSGGF